MREPVTRADLHRDIGGLKADMTNVKADVAEMKGNVKEGFANVEAKLQILLDERQQRIGIRKFVAILYTIGGSAVTLLAQWALKKLGGL